MKNIFKRIDNKKFLLLVPLFILIYSISTISLIYAILRINNVETFLRYMTSIFLSILLIYMILKSIRLIFKGTDLRTLLFSLVLVILFIIEAFGCTAINKVYNSINKINKDMIAYSTSLIAMKDSDIKKLSDIKNLKIGIIDDENSIDGYVIAKEIISENKLNKNNELVDYDTFASMLSDLYDKKIDVIFVSSNYATMFSNMNVEEGQKNKYANIKDETVVITTKSKQVEKENNSKGKTTLENPFTILVMGVDSTLDDINSGSAFNGDALMLITFNPKTFNATILSIPRDTFVPIMCFKNRIENKITHAAWYGESCMMSTIENFTGVKIDYYVKINFKGVVKLVDALGGVDIDVPYSFCEQNSNREWGNNTVYVTKGYQKLSGEQALALARNRHPNPVCGIKWANYSSDDLVRGQNQQKIINAVINEIKNIRNLNEVYNLLDLVQKNVDTSLSTNQMLSFYNIAKNILKNSKNTNADVVTFEHLYLEGHGQTIWDENMRLPLWDYIYYRGSLKEIVNAMNINLEKKAPTLIKEFYFSINEIYEQKIVGKGSYTEPWIKLVGNFVGKRKSDVLYWGTQNNVKINVEVKEVNGNYSNDQVLEQSLPSSYRIDHIGSSGMTITVAKVIEQTNNNSNNSIDCSKEDNANNSLCIVPNFSTYTIDTAKSWKNSVSSLLKVTVNEMPLLPGNSGDAGKCYYQSKDAGTKLSSIDEITISCYEKQE